MDETNLATAILQRTLRHRLHLNSDLEYLMLDGISMVLYMLKSDIEIFCIF